MRWWQVSRHKSFYLTARNHHETRVCGRDSFGDDQRRLHPGAAPDPAQPRRQRHQDRLPPARASRFQRGVGHQSHQPILGWLLDSDLLLMLYCEDARHCCWWMMWLCFQQLSDWPMRAMMCGWATLAVTPTPASIFPSIPVSRDTGNFRTSVQFD